MHILTADVLNGDYKLPHPVSIICSGSSGSGKVRCHNLEHSYEPLFSDNFHQKFNSAPQILKNSKENLLYLPKGTGDATGYLGPTFS